MNENSKKRDEGITKPKTAEEDWGRIAVSLPGWRWMPGMRGVRDDGSGDRIMDCSESSLPNHDIVPDPDDDGIRIALIRDASLLDGDSMQLVGDLAAEMGAQVWLERVGDADDGAVIIRDGGVVS